MFQPALSPILSDRGLPSVYRRRLGNTIPPRRIGRNAGLMAQHGEGWPPCATKTIVPIDASLHEKHHDTYTTITPRHSSHQQRVELGARKPCPPYDSHDAQIDASYDQPRPSTPISTSLQPCRSWSRLLCVVVLGIVLALLLLGTTSHSRCWTPSRVWSFPALLSTALAKDVEPVVSPAPGLDPLLSVFEVHEPVLVPTSSNGATNGASGGCSVLLMEHSFGFSYGVPFVGMLSHLGRSAIHEPLL